jgi:L-fuconolactonase
VKPVPIVDTHCHISVNWYEPVETLAAVMEHSGVSKAVLVQMFGELDNRYLLKCARTDPTRFAAVVLVDPKADLATGILKTLARRGARGVRLRATDRSQASDPLAIWKAARDLSMIVSCNGTSSEFSSAPFQRLLDQVPDLVVVLEHLASTSTPPRSRREVETRVASLKLNGPRPNVFIKLPGLSELLPRQEVRSSRLSPHALNFLRIAIEAYGPARMMWGSDFPIVCGREGYLNSRLLLRSALERVTKEGSAIFGGVANELFFNS